MQGRTILNHKTEIRRLQGLEDPSVAAGLHRKFFLNAIVLWHRPMYHKLVCLTEVVFQRWYCIAHSVSADVPNISLSTLQMSIVLVTRHNVQQNRTPLD